MLELCVRLLQSYPLCHEVRNILLDKESLLIIFAVLTPILLSIIDAVVGRFWPQLYLKMGIPIYVKRFSILNRASFARGSAKLLDEGLKGEWYASLVFRPISDSEILFKNKSFDMGLGFRLPLRGVVFIHRNGQVVVKCIWPLIIPVVILVIVYIQFSLYGFYFLERFGFSYWLMNLGGLFMVLLVQLFIFRYVVQRIEVYFEA